MGVIKIRQRWFIKNKYTNNWNHSLLQYEKERKLKNDKYDEAVEVSQSLDQKALANMSKAKLQSEEKEVSKGMKKGTEQTKSQSVMNKHFDEALEFSHSGSDDSVDTKSADKPKKGKEKLVESKQGNQITTSVQKSAGAQNSLAHLDTSSTNKKTTTSTTATSVRQQNIILCYESVLLWPQCVLLCVFVGHCPEVIPAGRCRRKEEGCRRRELQRRGRRARGELR